MKIEIVKLTLRNFKGIRDLTVNFGRITDVYGANATGKTTLFDAFSWLLFDKDSNNKKDFEIKTVDANGKTIHQLNHEVEGVLDIDGKHVSFRKVYSEKWTKKRGSVKQEFGGHTADYFIDGVPVKQKEYKDAVDDLVSEDIFKLVTNPAYFNVQLSWQERRKVLLDVCGDVTDGEVIASNSNLAKLPSILGDRSIEDQRKVIATKRKTINEELDKIPIRIDEAIRSKPDTEGLSEGQLQSEIDQLKFGVESKESEITRLQSGGQVTELQNRIREIDGELLELKNKSQSGTYDAIAKQRKTVSEMQAEIDHVESSIKRIGRSITTNQTDADEALKRAAELRVEWASVDSEEFNQAVDETCSACGQPLPEEKVADAHEKALRGFNQHKSELLEHIKTKGTQAKQRAADLGAENEKLNAERDSLQNRLSLESRNLESVTSELTRLESLVQDTSDSEELTAKKREKERLATKIGALRQSVLDDVEKVRSALMDTRDELRRKESMLARFDQARKLDERIEELRNQERALAAQFEELEEQLYLTEEFVKAKVQMLESRINSKFKFARFKLFSEQVNGGLQETCETLYDGVPYGSGLNNAARINVGLDIINTLAEHYGISAPIWIDNAESVVELFQTNAQMVALYVSAQDKKLRIETNDLKEAV